MQWVDTVRQIRNPLFLRYKALPSPLPHPPPPPPHFFGLVLPLSSATSRQYFLRTNQPAQVKSTCRSIFKDPDESLGNRTFEYWCCVLLSFFSFFQSSIINYGSTIIGWGGREKGRRPDSKRVTFHRLAIFKNDTIDRARDGIKRCSLNSYVSYRRLIILL